MAGHTALSCLSPLACPRPGVLVQTAPATLMTVQSPTVEAASPISRAETFSHRGFRVPDPFAPRERPGASFINAILATALFRCWHILLFYAAWSTLITVLNEQGHDLSIQPTLLTVIGTVLGFIISYRTTSSFERYNEGRRLWSQIILASRTMARTIWFHVPNNNPLEGQSMEEAKARSLVEKKSAVNLIEAFSVAIKHYLRGEDGIYYSDLYFLVKFLPAYALPAGRPSMSDLHAYPEDNPLVPDPPESPPSPSATRQSFTAAMSQVQNPSSPVSPGRQRSVSIASPPVSSLHHRAPPRGLPPPVSIGAPGPNSLPPPPMSPTSAHSTVLGGKKEKDRLILARQDETYLLPAKLPPKFAFFDIFPFSLLVHYMTRKGRDVKGKKAARLRAKLRNEAISHNLPLELSLYLSSYIAKLQNRKTCDVPTINTLLASLNQLVDSLTGLERILTSPIPFSYSVHLWVVTVVYCLALPFQIYTALRWVTIPSTILLSFIFFGFLVAGEEIENPFGYDKNDLNLDHFTHNIIRNELRAVTSAPPPDPEGWAFVAENNLLFVNDTETRITPSEWIARGPIAMQISLGQF